MNNPLDDICARLITEYRQELGGQDAAMFDLAVALELKRRGIKDTDMAQLLRLRAEEHRRAAPFYWSLMRSLADSMTPGGNVVSLPQLPGAKP